MRKFQLLLWNTIQKEFRSKTLIMMSIMTLVMILLLNSLLSFLSKEVLTSLGSEGAAKGTATGLIYIINKFTVLLSIIFGVNCIKSDVENNVAPLLLSFPVSRLEYLGSRILGSWVIVISYYFLSVLLAQILLSSTVGSLIGGPHLLGAMFFSALSNLVVIMTAAFLGIHMPKIMAFMLTSFTSILITSSNGYFKSKSWEEMTEAMSAIKAVGLGIHALFPRIGNLDDMGRMVLMQSDDMKFNIPMELLHYTVTVGLFFFLFYAIFKRREI